SITFGILTVSKFVQLKNRPYVLISGLVTNRIFSAVVFLNTSLPTFIKSSDNIFIFDIPVILLNAFSPIVVKALESIITLLIIVFSNADEPIVCKYVNEPSRFSKFEHS
ncbi:MAG: hypothetical protein VX716_04495, partial [SAR324 cluster bacterium]|nr:hypothetical protein [SAR324 cluster bacterium]